MQQVRRNGNALSCAGDCLRSDRELVLAAFRENAFALRWACPELQRDRVFMAQLVEESVFALPCTDMSLRADKDFMLAAVRWNPLAKEFVAPVLKQDPEFSRELDIVLGRKENCPVFHGIHHAGMALDHPHRKRSLDSVERVGWWSCCISRSTMEG